MKAPEHRTPRRGDREHVHHVKTERGVSTYQIRRGTGDDAEVLAAVAVYGAIDTKSLKTRCVTCGSSDCTHALRVRERAVTGR